MADDQGDAGTGKVRYWAVVPAAGIGSRMQAVAAGTPKQYLQIAGNSILSLTLSRLDTLEPLAAIVIALSGQDQWFAEETISLNAPLITVSGGKERMHSVFNCLQALETQAQARDWVLIHDAVRPCVSLEDINILIAALSASETGGLLAVPVSETLKRVRREGADNRVENTEPRENFWLAGTPQLFRYGVLKAALAQAIEDNVMITDEAHAMENAGHTVKVVQGSPDNIKITHAGDLVLAEHILARQAAP